jgi:hypothetical protein
MCPALAKLGAVGGRRRFFASGQTAFQDLLEPGPALFFGSTVCKAVLSRLKRIEFATLRTIGRWRRRFAAPQATPHYLFESRLAFLLRPAVIETGSRGLERQVLARLLAIGRWRRLTSLQTRIKDFVESLLTFICRTAIFQTYLPGLVCMPLADLRTYGLVRLAVLAHAGPERLDAHFSTFVARRARFQASIEDFGAVRFALVFAGRLGRRLAAFHAIGKMVLEFPLALFLRKAHLEAGAANVACGLLAGRRTIRIRRYRITFGGNALPQSRRAQLHAVSFRMSCFETCVESLICMSFADFFACRVGRRRDRVAFGGNAIAQFGRTHLRTMSFSVPCQEASLEEFVCTSFAQLLARRLGRRLAALHAIGKMMFEFPPALLLRMAHLETGVANFVCGLFAIYRTMQIRRNCGALLCYALL